jgi:hypothetical protein
MLIEKKITILVYIFLCFTFLQCASTEEPEIIDLTSYGASIEESNILGFGFFKRIPGLWNGPVKTTTPAGSFPKWYVDFRPVAPGQISQYSIVDADTLNYISFFVVKHQNKLKVAMRTEGVFQKKGCVTYEVLDTAKEEEGYYRFSDFQVGDKRAYTEFKFTKNQVLMETYTTKFNKVFPLELHSRWKAKLIDRKAVLPAIKDLNYPQPIIVKDFSNVFGNRFESIYYDLTKDPYQSKTQPYVGTVTVNISIAPELKVEKDHELFLLLTTESLFDGYNYIRENLKYISKFVYLSPDTRKYTLTHIHPGKYFLYSNNDVNGDKRHLKGDWMSSRLEHIIDVPPNGNITTDTLIDLVIP